MRFNMISQNYTASSFETHQRALPSPHVQHNEHTHKGMFVVFGVFPPFLSCRTPRICPCGHVFDVRHILCCSPCAEHYEHALVGMFVVFSAFPAFPLMSNTTNMPLWAFFWCSTCSLPFPLCQIPQTCPQRRIFGVRHVRCPSPLVEHVPPFPLLEHQKHAPLGTYLAFGAYPSHPLHHSLSSSPSISSIYPFSLFLY